MGGTQSREDLELVSESDSGSESGNESDSYYSPRSPTSKILTPPSIDAVDAQLRSLKLKYSSSSSNPSTVGQNPNAIKLYLHVGGSSPSARWIISDKLTSFSFSKADESDSDDAEVAPSHWFLKVGSKVRAKVGPALQLKSFPDQNRVDFVADGVWAIKFLNPDGYRIFHDSYKKCLFENTYGFEDNEEGKVKVFGKDFMAWAKPEAADDMLWEDAEAQFEKTPEKNEESYLEEFEEEANGGGIQSLALGALDNSFLVGDSGIQVVKNFAHGVHGKGISVKFSAGNSNRNNDMFSTPKKALLMRAETNMLLMSPLDAGKPHASGVHQLDIETGKVVTEWKFEKDGTDINMRDITNDGKGAQLDPSGSTFLGLYDNRLCRWDMRDKHGIVQNMANAMESPVLNWTQ